jgi:hypothetical protein
MFLSVYDPSQTPATAEGVAYDKTFTLLRPTYRHAQTVS